VTLAVVATSPRHMQERVTAIESAFPLALLGRLGSGRMGVLLCHLTRDEVRAELSKILGPSDLMNSTELTGLAGSSDSDALVGALEGRFSHVGLH
jgi:hypothetical protein